MVSPSSLLLLARDKNGVCDMMQLWVAKGFGDNVGNCMEDQELGPGLRAACETLQV